jgi:undecaprenyl-diphosphatase
MNLIDADYELFSAINGFHSVILDSFMEIVSSRVTAIPMYVLMALFLYKKYQSKFWWILGSVILLILISDQVSVAFKFTVERLRPCHDHLLSSTIHLVNNKCGGQFGFYSSHASNTAALSIFLMQFTRNRFVYFALITWVFLVGYSRIYLGAHFPGDVLSGWIAGGMLGWTIAKLSLRYLPIQQSN